MGLPLFCSCRVSVFKKKKKKQQAESNKFNSVQCSDVLLGKVAPIILLAAYNFEEHRNPANKNVAFPALCCFQTHSANQ